MVIALAVCFNMWAKIDPIHVLDFLNSAKDARGHVYTVSSLDGNGDISRTLLIHSSA